MTPPAPRDLPAHRDLRRVVGSLAARLPTQVDGMLDDARFDGGREALARLGDADHARTLDSLEPAEAAWLAEELRRRWAAVGDAVLDPVAWIEAGDRIEAPDGDAARALRAHDPAPPAGEEARVRLSVHVEGLEPGWTVAWSGAVPAQDDDAAATWTWTPRTDEPRTAEPRTAEPAATQPRTTEPAATQPPATEPAATQPPATEPHATWPPRVELPVSAPDGLGTPVPEHAAVTARVMGRGPDGRVIITASWSP